MLSRKGNVVRTELFCGALASLAAFIWGVTQRALRDVPNNCSNGDKFSKRFLASGKEAPYTAFTLRLPYVLIWRISLNRLVASRCRWWGGLGTSSVPGTSRRNCRSDVWHPSLRHWKRWNFDRLLTETFVYASIVASFNAFILLPEKFLSFDWLRAEVFQLNLKYLHVKITVTITKSSRRTSYAKMAERFRDFEGRRFKN